MATFGSVISAYLAYERLAGFDVSLNRPILFLGILLIITGVQLVTLGLLAELQARTYHESQNKPTYVIREIRQTAAVERARAGR
jgi:dolichol-phosphate mannosyltransferase